MVNLFKRKIESKIMRYLNDEDSPILLIDGARQIGKTFIIRELESRYFKDFVELNMVEDYAGPRIFENVEGIVLSNDGDLIRKGKVTYLPVYMSMFL